MVPFWNGYCNLVTQIAVEPGGPGGILDCQCLKKKPSPFGKPCVFLNGGATRTFITYMLYFYVCDVAHSPYVSPPFASHLVGSNPFVIKHDPRPGYLNRMGGLKPLLK